MTGKDLDKIISTIKQATENTIETAVNGKIRRIDEKFETFYIENAQFVRDSVEWRKTLQPVVDAYSTAENAGKFIKWIGGISMAGGALMGLRHFW